MNEKRLGNAPIETEQLKSIMNSLAKMIDVSINGKNYIPGKRQNGFLLMIFPFEGFDGRCNYISSVDRKDVIVLLKEQLAYFEGQAEIKGRA